MFYSGVKVVNAWHRKLSPRRQSPPCRAPGRGRGRGRRAGRRGGRECVGRAARRAAAASERDAAGVCSGPTVRDPPMMLCFAMIKRCHIYKCYNLENIFVIISDLPVQVCTLGPVFLILYTCSIKNNILFIVMKKASAA